MARSGLFEHTSRRPWDPGDSCAPPAGERFLVTGAGGSIGAALALRLASADPARLILLERSEHHLFGLERRLAETGAAPRFVLGDAGDPALVERLLGEERPRLIFHAAAHKQAPLLESQPFEACRNNTTVTRRLLAAATAAGVERFVLLSTDKAVEPAGIMGVSKWLAERAVRLAGPLPTATAIRLGNVWGSRGSVVPRFAEQLAAGAQLTVTDPRVRRFFLSGDEAVAAILAAAFHGGPGEILLPEMGEPLSILSIAERMLESVGESSPEKRIHITGLRPGDKREERLLAGDERVESTAVEGLHRIAAPALDGNLWNVVLDEIDTAAVERNGERLLEAVRQLLPGFVPGDTLRAALAPRTRGGLLEASS